MFLFVFFSLFPLLLLNLLEVLWMKDEIASEVFLSYDAVFCQLWRCAFEEDSSFKKQVCAVGDAKRLLHVMVGDEDSDVSVFQLPYHILDILNRYRVNTCKRFVKHDEFRVDGEASCDFATSSLTSGELIAVILPHLLEVELIEELFEMLFLLRR